MRSEERRAQQWLKKDFGLALRQYKSDLHAAGIAYRAALRAAEKQLIKTRHAAEDVYKQNMRAIAKDK